MFDAKRDNNMVPTLIGVSSVDGITPVTVYVDPVTHRVLTSSSGGSLAGLSDVTITSVAQGDILYYNGTKWVNLPAGTSGLALRTGGAGANPAWGTLAEAALAFSDVTTGNVTSTAHGFAPKSPGNTGKFLNGAATPGYTTPGTRETTTASASTVTPSWDTDDIITITAQAAGLTLANPGGTPVQGQKLIVRIKDNASPQTIAYGTQYRALGNTLPTTTVASKTLYLGFIWNSTDTKLDLVAVAQEA